MENSNIRVLPRVCGNGDCKELIITPITEQLHEFKDIQCTKIIEVCRKCKDKS